MSASARTPRSRSMTATCEVASPPARPPRALTHTQRSDGGAASLTERQQHGEALGDLDVGERGTRVHAQELHLAHAQQALHGQPRVLHVAA
jgi:hypothetical protein